MSIAHFHIEQKSENFAPELFMGKNKRCRSSALTKGLKERGKKNQNKQNQTSCILRAKQTEKEQDLFFHICTGQSCPSHLFWKPQYQPRALSRKFPQRWHQHLRPCHGLLSKMLPCSPQSSHQVPVCTREVLHTLICNIWKNRRCGQKAKACTTASSNMGCLPNRCSQGWITTYTYSVLQSLQGSPLSQEAALTSSPMTSVKMLHPASRILYPTKGYGNAFCTVCRTAA